MRQRTIVCPIIQNDGAYLLCKMADDRGVFPGRIVPLMEAHQIDIGHVALFCQRKRVRFTMFRSPLR